MGRKNMSSLMVCILVISLVTACNRNTENATRSSQDAPTIYKNFCLSCHGVNLEGFRGPNIQMIGSRLTEEQIIVQIQKGADGMPGFKASIQQSDIEKLASWLSDKK